MPLTDDPNANFRGYILAGGASTRFGRDKALVSFGGQPLLLRIASLLKTPTPDVAIVGAAEKYRHLDPQLAILEDRWPGEGPLGGIVTALEHSAAAHPLANWNVILSCDLPFLTSAWLQELIDRARAAAPEVQVILPHSAHGPEPLCACYRTDAAPALKSAFFGGVRKVTQALKQVRTEVLDDSVWKRFDSAGRLFWNMNTPADFDEAQRLYRSQREGSQDT